MSDKEPQRSLLSPFQSSQSTCEVLRALVRLKELERRRVEIVRMRYESGKSFMVREKLLAVRNGKKAKNPKKSKRHSFRARVLSVCSKTRQQFLDWYFRCQDQYRRASALYREGDDTAGSPGIAAVKDDELVITPSHCAPESILKCSENNL